LKMTVKGTDLLTNIHLFAKELRVSHKRLDTHVSSIYPKPNEAT
jgi:hypothetical protein